MDIGLSEKAEKILDMLISGMEKAGTAANAELPQLMEQYVVYFIVDAVTHIIAGVVGLILCSLIAKKVTPLLIDASETKGDKVFAFCMLAMALATPVGFAGIAVVKGGSSVVKWTAAPKAALIENFRK